MASYHPEAAELLRAKINSETAQLNWLELEPHFAHGSLIRISPALDLLDAALAIAHDQAAQIRHWQTDGLLAAVSDDEARQWQASNARLWTVVVKPFILVQPLTSSHDQLQ